MYGCPNCGSNLKYNIQLKKMSCEHCDSVFNPNQFGDAEGAKQSDLEVTVFTCPQCAGELYTTDNEMAGFCSFCGASTVLESRIANEKRPDYIIPFQKTKEDCKEEYLKRIHKVFFVPKELKSMEYVEGFRGIYMPYWIYDVKQEGQLSFDGKKRKWEYDYDITSYYKLEGELSAQYEGITYDASSSFPDDMSKNVAPYKLNALSEFSPVYLSGFYADASDLEASVYEDDVVGMTEQMTGEYVKNHYDLVPYMINKKDEQIRELMNTTIERQAQAMLPVWFMSYRSKEWVSYAAVNGQTGKVAFDLPMDFKKYLVLSVVVAIPLFFLVGLADSACNITLPILLQMLLVLASFVSVLHAGRILRIARRERLKDDKGARVAKLRKNNKSIKEKKRNKRLRRKKDKGFNWEFGPEGIIFMAFVFICCAAYEDFNGLVAVLEFGLEFCSMLLGGIPYEMILFGITMLASGIAFVVSAVSLVKSAGLKLWKGVPLPLCTLVSVIVSVFILCAGKLTDITCSICVLLLGSVLIITMIDLIGKHNVLNTRRLPSARRGLLNVALFLLMLSAPSLQVQAKTNYAQHVMVLEQTMEYVMFNEQVVVCVKYIGLAMFSLILSMILMYRIANKSLKRYSEMDEEWLDGIVVKQDIHNLKEKFLYEDKKYAPKKQRNSDY